MNIVGCINPIESCYHLACATTDSHSKLKLEFYTKTQTRRFQNVMNYLSPIVINISAQVYNLNYKTHNNLLTIYLSMHKSTKISICSQLQTSNTHAQKIRNGSSIKKNIQTAARSTSVGIRLQKLPWYSCTWIPCQKQKENCVKYDA